MTDSLSDIFCKLIEQYCIIADLTLDELLIQLSRRLTTETSWESVKGAILINDQMQIDAEVALEKISKLFLQKKMAVRHWSLSPGRDVDWERTIQARHAGRRGAYCSIKHIGVPDKQILGAIRGVAYRWLFLLREIPMVEDRERRLLKMQKVVQDLHFDLHPWNPVVHKKLHHFDASAADAMGKAMTLWSGVGSRGEALGRKFSDWASKSNNGRSFQFNNQDTIFEWMTAIRISEIAYQRCGWKFLSSNNISQKKYGDLILAKDNYCLRISKGFPLDGNGHRILRADTHNSLVEDSQIRAGLKPSGFQPDIVLTFFKKEIPNNVVFFLADAKRNEGGDGRGYVGTSIQKAAVYLGAFKDHPGFLSPHCALFFWQGIEKIGGYDIRNVDAVKNFIERDVLSDEPSIVCFDRQTFFQEDQFLACWINALYEKAMEHLALTS